MSSLFTRASLKRSSRTHTRKDNIPGEVLSRSSTLTRRKTRPPPLQIIPELSENDLDFGGSPFYSPATARPTQFTPRQPELQSSRTTLSAYTFSIDDALFMFGDDTPRSPALSASSSISDGTSSEDVPPTPSTSEDEDYVLPTPRLCPRRISIRPLCITKTRSLVCQEEEDIRSHFEDEEEKAISLQVVEQPFGHPVEVRAATNTAQEIEQDFYTSEFENFITLTPVVPSPTLSARRDSLTLTVETLATVTKTPEPTSRGRSRHSKPLPLPPLTTPPISSFPSIPTFPLVQTTARSSVVRRQRNVLVPSNYPAPSPAQFRPRPQVAVPLDIEDCIFPEEDFDAPSRGPIVIEQVHDAEEDTSVYSPSPYGYCATASTRQLPPAIPETPLAEMYRVVALPRASIDSDAPRSSVDSTLSFASSTSSTTAISPLSFPSTPSPECHEADSTQRLRSRWSCSTLASIDVEPARAPSLLSPLRSVFGSRPRWASPPPQKAAPRTPPHATPSKSPKNKHDSSTTPSPPSTPEKRIRRQGSRSSTSSTEHESREGSPSGLKRKPIPVVMFLRTGSGATK